MVRTEDFGKLRTAQDVYDALNVLHTATVDTVLGIECDLLAEIIDTAMEEIATRYYVRRA